MVIFINLTSVHYYSENKSKKKTKQPYNAGY